MKQDEKINELGLMGEKIIGNYLNEQGYTVKHSVDKYDSEKDLIVDNKKVEVKTQVPFISENAFSFKPDQLRKCRNVDVLYFISVPPSKHHDKWAGWIFRVDPKTFVTKTRITKSGREMILIPRNQPAVTPVKRISTDEMEQLRKYSVSEY